MTEPHEVRPIPLDAAGRPLAPVGPATDPALVPPMEELVEAVVLAVPGVVRLHGGPFGGLGTYLPGRRVTGVRIDDAGTEVHVVVSGTEPITAVAGRLQRALSEVAPLPVRVHVEDIDVPDVLTQE